MANRLALIGCAEGPWVCIAQTKRPALRVSGLKTGRVSALIKLACGDIAIIGTEENGELAIKDEKPEWIKLSASHPSSSLICAIVDQVA